MHAVGLQLVHQIGAVVEDECRTGLAAHVAYRASRFDDRLRGRILHAQLYPAAAAAKHGLGGRYFVVSFGMMRYELKHDSV